MKALRWIALPLTLLLVGCAPREVPPPTEAAPAAPAVYSLGDCPLFELPWEELGFLSWEDGYIGNGWQVRDSRQLAELAARFQQLSFREGPAQGEGLLRFAFYQNEGDPQPLFRLELNPLSVELDGQRFGPYVLQSDEAFLEELLQSATPQHTLELRPAWKGNGEAPAQRLYLLVPYGWEAQTSSLRYLGQPLAELSFCPAEALTQELQSAQPLDLGGKSFYRQAQESRATYYYVEEELCCRFVFGLEEEAPSAEEIESVLGTLLLIAA